MKTSTTEPITPNWTPHPNDPVLSDGPRTTARELNHALADCKVADLDDGLIPFLAAAAAELALGAGISWRFSADDAPVALLRVIARAGIAAPQAGGPHTDRLLNQLREG